MFEQSFTGVNIALAPALPALAGYCLQSCHLPYQRRSLLRLASCTPLRTSIFRKMDYFWRGRNQDNKGLVESLQKSRFISSKRVADVMEQIDRAIFVPPNGDPYVDSPVPIGFNATISAPHMHASCLELLSQYLQPGMHALDVGAGTGYLTAAFALLVGREGRAVGVEHIPELTEQAIKNVKKSKANHLLASGCLSIHTGDGREGFPQQAPYNAIHVGAAASEVPPALLEQLKPGGRMVIPVGDVFQELLVIDKDAGGDLKRWAASSVRYVPLTSRQSQLGEVK